MRLDLQTWGVNSLVIRDRPDPSVFRDYTFEQMNFVLKKYAIKLSPEALLVVSSTSWTPDEDFSILLKALQLYDQSAGADWPQIACVITGKGPLKDYYMGEVERRSQSWRKISVRSVWLDIRDYPILLNRASLGVCLHYSSSGLDLPMTVVDMFGAGLPVLAIQFPTIHQLVQHQKNGLLFSGSDQLFQQLADLAKNRLKLARLRQGAQAWRSATFHDQWKPHLSILSSDI